MTKTSSQYLFKHPIVLIWFIISAAAMVASVLIGSFVDPMNNLFWVIVGILLSQVSASIFFPILVGYFYDRIKEQESGDAVWRVFKEFERGGILGVYRDRERNADENAESNLKQAFVESKGQIKLIGVTLRVFFHQNSAFYSEIYEIVKRPPVPKKNLPKIKALVSHPQSNEVKMRAEIESPNIKLDKSLIVSEIEAFLRNVENLNSNVEKRDAIEYGFFMSAPYCTAVIFEDKCYFSPNILSKVAPVKLPMIIFHSNSHGYKVISEYFDYLWERRILTLTP